MNAIGELWLKLLRLGRGGGVVMLLLGLAALYAGWWLEATLGPTKLEVIWSPHTFVAYALILSGIPFVVAGVRNLLVAAPAENRVAVEGLIAAVTARARPFYVCTRCRQIFAPRECRGGRCLECGSFEHCHEVETDQDFERLMDELTSATVG